MLSNRNYYLNDYFDIFNTAYAREKEYMKTDIYESDGKYYLEIDLPGIKKEHIKINYNNGYLTISAKKSTLKINTKTYIRKERFDGEIKRSFYIGIKRESDLLAKYFEGILTISFPKEDIQSKTNKNITVN